jgi:hypothetical protein
MHADVDGVLRATTGEYAVQVPQDARRSRSVYHGDTIRQGVFVTTNVGPRDLTLLSTVMMV